MVITNEQIHTMVMQFECEMKEFIENAKASCVCYGNSLMIHGALEELSEDGFNVRYIVDDTPEKQGRVVDGIEVVSRLDERIRSEKYIIGTNSSVKRMRENFEWGGEKNRYFLCRFVNILFGNILMSVYM